MFSTRFFGVYTSVGCCLFILRGFTRACSSAINIENQCFTKLTPDFTPENVKSGVFCLRLTIDIGAGGSLPKVVTHRLEVDTYFTDLYSARSKGVIKNASKLIR